MMCYQSRKLTRYHNYNTLSGDDSRRSHTKIQYDGTRLYRRYNTLTLIDAIATKWVMIKWILKGKTI